MAIHPITEDMTPIDGATITGPVPAAAAPAPTPRAVRQPAPPPQQLRAHPQASSA